METKHCIICGKNKPLSEFYSHKTGRQAGQSYSRCKHCDKATSVEWKKSNPEKAKAINSKWRNANPERARQLDREHRYRHGAKPASENKACAVYLGCVVAETVLSKEFPGFKRMPYGNPNYDYECPKGFLIDIKSRCRSHRKNRKDFWRFSIRNNKVADYFLCIAFDNRKLLNPEHLWLIPGDVINDRSDLTISSSPESLDKWSQYERPLKNMLECCNKLREGQ